MKEIKLTQGKVALVDDEDYEWLSQWNWCIHNNFKTLYAERGFRIKGKNKIVRMHRQILGLTDPKILTDHIDRNGLNNQRSNLRIATKSGNGANKNSKQNSTSKYLGVHFCKRVNKWEVHIKKGKIKKYLGRFLSEQDAAIVYNKAAVELHGEFANLNTI